MKPSKPMKINDATKKWIARYKIPYTNLQMMDGAGINEIQAIVNAHGMFASRPG